MPLDLKILYRGPLSSCNYGCEYCPFAKREETAAELQRDRDALDRFVSWIASRPAGDNLSVFFTPWGEGLVRRWYQDALVRLTNLPTLQKAAIQTNLSASLRWVEQCDASKLALWATYHPEWVERPRFVERVRRLHAQGVSVSVGLVGFNRFQEEAAALRRELPPDVYLWVNAVKSWNGGERYSEEDLRHFEAIDPLFRLNTVNHPSAGRTCRAGQSVISVDGDGTMRRCHFIPDVIGNLYAPNFEESLQERRCTKATCGCHIGYVHLDYLNLGQVFGSGILERVPAAPVWKPGTALPVIA